MLLISSSGQHWINADDDNGYTATTFNDPNNYYSDDVTIVNGIPIAGYYCCL